MQSKIKVDHICKKIIVLLSELPLHPTGPYRTKIEGVLSSDLEATLDDFSEKWLCRIYDIRQWVVTDGFPNFNPSYVDSCITATETARCRVLIAYNILSDNFTIAIDFEVTALTGQ